MQAGGPVLAEHLLKDFRTSLFLKKKKKKLLWNAETFLQVGLVYKIQYLNLILEIFSTMLSYSNIKILKKKILTLQQPEVGSDSMKLPAAACFLTN